MLPVRLLAGVASELLFPGLSRLQDDGPRFALMFRRALVIAALVIAPIAVALHVAAEPLTDAVGGDWPNSRPLVAILAFVAVPQTLMSVVFPVILAVGRTTLLFWWSLTTSCCSIVAYLIGAQFGVEGVAWSFLIVLCVLFVPHMMIAGRCARVSVFEILADLFPVVLAGAAVVPVGYAVRELLQSASSPDAVTTVAAALVVGLTFVVISVVLRIAAFRDLVSLAPGTDRAVEWLSMRCTRGPSLTEPESAQA